MARRLSAPRAGNSTDMPLPKDIRFISFDCYGTLIDWESGAYDAFQKEADRDGFTVDRDTLIPLFLDTQHEIMSGSYELYAEVMRRTAIRCAAELGWDLEPSRAQFLPDSIPTSCSAPRVGTSVPTGTWW